jgi:hypothetical protein
MAAHISAVLTPRVQVRPTASQLTYQRLVLLLHLLRRAQEEPRAGRRPAQAGMERGGRAALRQPAGAGAGQGLYLPEGEESRDCSQDYGQREGSRRGDREDRDRQPR